MDGHLFIISGPSGAGKGTIVQGILERRPEMRLVVSSTTRPARPMERHGTHYFFIPRREFLEMRQRGDFLEWAEVHGNLYGTPRNHVEDLLERGHDVILEIDVQGAAQVKAQMPQAVLIFIEAPSIQDLQRRLQKRGTEDEDIGRRISAAHEELRRRGAFDLVVVNVDVERAVQEVLLFMDQYKESNK